MKHDSNAQTIGWFQEQYKSGRLELRPPFQRKPVWLDKQRSSLIESILLNIPIPEIYIQVSQAEDGAQEYGVVDGQQRLRSILQFIGLESEQDQKDGLDHNNFALDALPPTSVFHGKVFADIKNEPRKTFFQYSISVRFLYTDSTKEIEDVFKRLNKFSMPLKPQELRNATFHGPFAKLSETLANDEYWATNRIVTAASIRRMGDIEMMSDLLVGLLHGPQGGSAKVLNDYYEQYEPFDEEFPDQPRVEKAFARALAAIQRLFPKIREVPRWGNRADFYSLFVAFGNLLEENDLLKSKEKELHEKLIKFANDVSKRLASPSASVSNPAVEYARAIEKGSNDKARRADRHDALVGIIKPFLVPKK